LPDDDSEDNEGVPHSGTETATPLCRGVLKRAGSEFGAHAPKRVRFSADSRVQGRSSRLGGRNLMAECN
jgi:hypothetical protein